MEELQTPLPQITSGRGNPFLHINQASLRHRINKVMPNPKHPSTTDQNLKMVYVDKNICIKRSTYEKKTKYHENFYFFNKEKVIFVLSGYRSF